jgi:NAD(P)H dehydrogenase (quinone)
LSYQIEKIMKDQGKINKEKYAVIGITGQVGSHLADQLIKNGQSLRAVVRNPAKALGWAQRGVEIAVAELHDAAALTIAFTGMDGVFVMTPPMFGSIDPMNDHLEMLKALKSAITSSGVKKVVYLSSVGAQHSEGTGAIKKLYDMEHAFTDLPVPSAGIRAAWFMENFNGAIAHAAETGYLGSFLNPTSFAVPMIAASDIGRLAAELLQQEWDGRRILELEGPCRYSADDVALVISTYLKLPVTAKAIPEEQYTDTYLSFGFTPAAALLMTEMVHGFNKKWIVFEEEPVEHVYGETLLEDALRVSPT